MFLHIHTVFMRNKIAFGPRLTLCSSKRSDYIDFVTLSLDLGKRLHDLDTETYLWISINQYLWISIKGCIYGSPKMVVFMDLHKWFYLWISINELWISINQNDLWISINDLWISINELWRSIYTTIYGDP